ncbi:MAG TPA: hypothetical protein PLN86_00145 [Candidatus Hydrogenedentes bacterium]|nr:hypothetical protein [Candidatus Hydrogenedentota bacterium]
MNPLIKRQIDLLLDTIAEISACLDNAKSHISQLTKERDKLIQEQWRLKKQVSTFQRVSEEYDKVCSDVETKEHLIDSLKQGLNDLLEKVKRLRGGIKE